MLLEDDEYLLLLDEAGSLVGHSKSPDEIANMLSRTGLTPFWLTPVTEETSLRKANPPRGVKLPVAAPSPDITNTAYLRSRQAQERTTLPTYSFEDIRNVDLEEAGRVLQPIFEEANEAAIDEVYRTYGIMPGKQVNTDPNTWTLPKRGLLGENAKLHKPDNRAKFKTIALGLSLLPEASIFRGRAEAWYQSGYSLNMADPSIVVRGDTLQPGPVLGLNAPVNTLCPGSSAQCRSTCLVFVGQNQSSVGPNYVKWARTKSLIMYPEAFLRILLEAVIKYRNTKAKEYGGADTIKFARLNVFSDIPWETVVPWLFDMFDETKRAQGKQFHTLNFYDYTKIGGRPFLPNYHLTYSYAGTSGSLRQANAELDAGRNVAIVFVAQSYSKYLGSTFKKQATKGLRKGSPKYEAKTVKAAREWRKYNPLPKFVADPKLMGGQPIEVVDADYSDIRPLDPRGGRIVGLRWKPPTLSKKSGQRGKHTLDQAPFGFVVIGRIFRTPEGPVFILPDTPLSQPTTANKDQAVEGYLRQVIYDRSYTLPENIRKYEQYEVFGKPEIRP